MNYTFDFMPVLASWDRLLVGAWLTVKLSTLAMALGFALGTLCAIGRLSGVAWLRTLVGGYLEPIRKTPLLVQVFIVYFGLASMGLQLSAETSALLTLVIIPVTYEVVDRWMERWHREAPAEPAPPAPPPTAG